MKLAAFPKCYMDELVRDRTMTLFQWIDMAAELPVDGLELYDGTLTSFDDAYLKKVREAHARHKLEMPMLCCSSDFTQPRAEDRRKEVEHEKLMVDHGTERHRGNSGFRGIPAPVHRCVRASVCTWRLPDAGRRSGFTYGTTH